MKKNLQEQISRIKSMMLINEDEMTSSIDQTENELGIQIEPEEAEAIMNCEEEDEVPAEHESTFQKIKSAINNISDRSTLKSVFNQIRTSLRNLKKGKQTQMEQAEVAAVSILGVPLSTVALGAIGVFLLIAIIKRLLRKKEGTTQGCRAGASDMRREFGRKLF